MITSVNYKIQYDLFRYFTQYVTAELRYFTRQLEICRPLCLQLQKEVIISVEKFIR